MLWHENLAKLDEKYNLEQFVYLALDMNSEHPNLSLVNRILDILDALRKGQKDDSIGSPTSGGSPTSQQSNYRSIMKEAFLKKIEGYKTQGQDPRVISDMKKAFIKKIEMEKAKMELELATSKGKL